MNLIKQAVEMHKESIRCFNEFYIAKWDEGENKLILAIITSLESCELYIRYLLCYKSQLLLFKNMYDEMVIEILSGEYQSIDISLHTINFGEILILFDKFYKGEFDCSETEQYYICLSNWLNKLYYKDFSNEIDYVKLIRDILRVYYLLEVFFLYVDDLKSIEEKEDLNKVMGRYKKLCSNFWEEYSETLSKKDF